MKKLLFLLCSFVSSACFAQVGNGSFENGSSPDLSGWEWTCGAELINSAPLTGGNWCIKVTGGNVKSCFPGYAYQRIPSITNGQTFTLSGWAFTQTPRMIGLYFGTINKGVITTQAGDTTTSSAWKLLSIKSSFALSDGDTAVVVLFGGIAAGPFQGYGYFDLIDLQEITDIEPVPQGHTLRISPNPFSGQAILHSDIPFKDASLLVYSANGQMARKANHISGQSYSFSRGNLPQGLYFLQVKENARVIGWTKIVITDF